MSIEAFLSNYPPGDRLRSLLKEFKDSDHSLVVACADAFARAGSDGFRALSRKYSEANTLTYNSDIIRKLIREGEKEIAALFLGATIKIGVEEALTDQIYSHKRFLESINSALKGSALPSFEISMPYFEEISPEKLKRMYAAAASDKTLAEFIRKNDTLLPSVLNRFLTEHELYVPMFRLLPDYETRARIAIVEHTSTI